MGRKKKSRRKASPPPPAVPIIKVSGPNLTGSNIPQPTEGGPSSSGLSASGPPAGLSPGSPSSNPNLLSPPSPGSDSTSSESTGERRRKRKPPKPLPTAKGLLFLIADDGSYKTFRNTFDVNEKRVMKFSMDSMAAKCGLSGSEARCVMLMRTLDNESFEKITSDLKVELEYEYFFFVISSDLRMITKNSFDVILDANYQHVMGVNLTLARALGGNILEMNMRPLHNIEIELDLQINLGSIGDVVKTVVPCNANNAEAAFTTALSREDLSTNVYHFVFGHFDGDPPHFLAPDLNRPVDKDRKFLLWIHKLLSKPATEIYPAFYLHFVDVYYADGLYARTVTFVNNIESQMDCYRKCFIQVEGVDYDSFVILDAERRIGRVSLLNIPEGQHCGRCCVVHSDGSRELHAVLLRTETCTQAHFLNKVAKVSKTPQNQLRDPPAQMCRLRLEGDPPCTQTVKQRFINLRGDELIRASTIYHLCVDRAARTHLEAWNDQANFPTRQVIPQEYLRLILPALQRLIARYPNTEAGPNPNPAAPPNPEDPQAPPNPEAPPSNP